MAPKRIQTSDRRKIPHLGHVWDQIALDFRSFAIFWVNVISNLGNVGAKIRCQFHNRHFDGARVVCGAVGVVYGP
jgi:hypothetical protein